MKSILVLIALMFPLAVSAVSRADDGSGSSVAVVIDAGPVAAGSGSATAAQPVNPVTDPAGYIGELQNAKQTGWPLFVLVGAFGLCELLAAAGSKVAALAWLGTGRVSIVIGGLVAMTAAMINKLADGGTWTSVLLGALAPAALLFYHPAAVDVAVNKAAKA